MFFWLEFEFKLGILRMICMVNLSSLSLTSCVSRQGDRGASTCLLSSALHCPGAKKVDKPLGAAESVEPGHGLGAG